MRSVLTLVFVLSAAGAYAYDTTGYITMTASDSTTSSSFNSAGKWSDGKAPSAGKKYFVQSGRTLYTPNTGSATSPLVLTFAGDELAVTGTLWPLGGSLSANRLTINNLVMIGGGALRTSSTRPFFWGKTTVVESSRTKPVIFCGGTGGGTSFDKGAYVFEHGATMSAGGAEVVRFDEGTNEGKSYYGNFALTGSQATFFGTYLLTKHTSLCLSGKTDATVEVGEGAVFRTWFNRQPTTITGGGMQYFDPEVKTVDVASGGTLEVSASNTLTVANLHLAEGARISLLAEGGRCGQLLVTGKLTVDGPVALDAGSTFGVVTGAPPAFAMITLAKGAKGDEYLDLIALDEDSITRVGSLPHITRQVVTEADGSRTIRYSQREIVKLVQSGTMGDENNSPLICAHDTANKYYWSDHEAPTAGKDYYVATGYCINMPLCEEMVDFKGDSLTLSGNSYITSGSKSFCAGFNVGEFGLEGGAYVQIWSGNELPDAYGFVTMCIGGETFTVKGAKGGILRPYGNKMIRVTSNIVGDGLLTLTSLQNASNEGPRGTIELLGDNSGFSGKLLVTLPTDTRSRESEWGDTVPNEGIFARCIAGGDATLGGPMPEFTPDGVRVDQRSQLRITADTTLDAENRGVTFSGYARVLIDPDCTFAIMNPVRFDGTLRLEGDGILGLGGEMSFKNGSALPTVGTDVVDVRSGGLKPMHPHALDGAEIHLGADGLKFIYEIEPYEDGMQQYGLVNVKTTKPFVFGTGVETINVEIDFGGGPDGAPTVDYDLGLFTVANKTLAQDLFDRIRIRTNYARNNLELKMAENDLGYWTVYAHFGPKPSAMIIYH